MCCHLSSKCKQVQEYIVAGKPTSVFGNYKPCFNTGAYIASYISFVT